MHEHVSNDNKYANTSVKENKTFNDIILQKKHHIFCVFEERKIIFHSKLILLQFPLIDILFNVSGLIPSKQHFKIGIYHLQIRLGEFQFHFRPLNKSLNNNLVKSSRHKLHSHNTQHVDSLLLRSAQKSFKQCQTRLLP